MLNEHKSTIASIVTPPGEGGIGKIIVSGPDALGIVNKTFQGKGVADLRDAASHKLYYGSIHEKGQRIDEVIVGVMRQEDSLTGEDVVEVNCHGGVRVLMRVYECLQAAGAKGAAWDSLLLQSCKNEKMDFVRKEALQGIVQAQTRLGTKVLLDQYAGALSKALKKELRIIEEISTSLNPKDESIFPSTTRRKPSVVENGACSLVSSLADFIGNLLETAPLGMALTTPQVLVILGKPNVGKSTLINAILGEERMLVHHEPGTTRDYVSEFISIEGIPFELVDTAGVRETSDRLEAMSIGMTQEQLQRADKVIVVFDNSRRFDQEDEGILNAVNSWLKTAAPGHSQRIPNGRPVIPVINKCDLPANLETSKIETALQQPVCCLSALNKEGFEDLNRQLVQEFNTAYQPANPVVFNKRQYLLLTNAHNLAGQLKDCLVSNKVSERAIRMLDELNNIFIACLKGP